MIRPVICSNGIVLMRLAQTAGFRGFGLADYKDRLLEIHGSNMWNGFHVQRAIEFAKRYGLTGIIFHANDIIDKAIKPDKYFPPNVSLLQYNNRDGDTKNYKYYLKNVIDKITDAGLQFYVEVKEIYFPYEILSEYPHLRKENGAICPTDPFWWEFLEEKLSEFARRFPKASGVIVSAGTRESMVSLALNKCVCDRCKSYTMDRWYRELMAAMFRPLDKAGMKLIVREFSYTADHQYAMIDAAMDVSDKIIIAIKKAPHDYYPTFPLNPTAGHCGSLEQWIEYDTWGQYFGLGVMPCSVAEDMQQRMRYYKDKGATGVMLRTDWERLLNGSTFNAFTMLNLIAGAMLSKDVDTDLDDVYRAWLDYGLLSPLEYDTWNQKPCTPTSPEAFEVLKRFMKDAWRIQERTIYVRGHVFNRNAQMFDRYFLTYFIMTVQHTRDHWDKDASKLVSPTDENIETMIKEKDEGIAIANSLRTYLKPSTLGVSKVIEKYLQFLLDVYPLYAEIFKAQIITAAYIKRAEEFGDLEFLDKAKATLAGYDELAARLGKLIDGKQYSNNVEYVLDKDRVLRFKDNCASVINELRFKGEKI